MLKHYQTQAVNQAVHALRTQNAYGLLLGCGLGKTLVSLTIFDTLQFKRVLVTAPCRVIHHWLEERQRWETKLPVVPLVGTPQKREDLLNVIPSAIFVISHDNLHWLSKLKTTPFDCMLIDESSKFKSWSSLRSKSARHLSARTKYRLLLTGTPTPNCPSEIFPQQVFLDRGATLGNTLTKFRDRFCVRGGFENREFVFLPQKAAELQSAISPYYLRQSALDHLDIPAIRSNLVRLTLPPATKTLYASMAKSLISELSSGPLLAMTGSDRYRMCKQLASGCVYTDYPSHELVHTEKIEALKDLFQEIGPKPVIVSYQYKCELAELQKVFPKSFTINGDVTPAQSQRVIQQFQQANLPMFVQSASVSHGIDGLQKTCSDLVFFSLPDSGEVHEQLIARLYRSGQTQSVCIHYLLATGTIDVAVYRLLQEKKFNQESLLASLQNGIE